MPEESFAYRAPENVPGKFYVDDQCLDCDLCRETAPTVFARNDDEGWTYVKKQPETEEELAQAMESLEGCPCEAIHADGDAHDWSVPPQVARTTGEKRKCQCCGKKKPWWRFW